MTSAEEPAFDDSHLRRTVLTVIALFGLAALGTMLNRGCSLTYVADTTPVPTDRTNTAVIVWGLGLAVAAIPLAIYGIAQTPKTWLAYKIAFAIALIVCCGRSPVTRIVNPQDYVNWPLLVCFTIPTVGVLATGALSRYLLETAEHRASRKKRRR